MPVQWITYKGKQILYCNYVGLRNPQLIEEFKLEDKMLHESPGKVLLLNDYTDVVMDTEAMNYLKSVGKAAEEKTEKLALIGVTGLKQFLLISYNWVTGAADHEKLFTDVDEAKEWLVE